MTALGIQIWAQLFGGAWIIFGHACLKELLEVLQVLGGSYRLASTTGGGSSLACGRFLAGFCRAMAAKVACTVELPS